MSGEKKPDPATMRRIAAECREDEGIPRSVIERAVSDDVLRWCRPGYLVHRSGIVLTARSEGRGSFPDKWTIARLLALHDNGKGYPCVNLRIDGKVVRASVHSLVAETFLGPRPDGMEVRHLDGKRDHCCVHNLAWGTSADNTDDSRQHGTLARGERVGNSKLTETQVREILADKGSQRDIAKRFGITQSAVCNIKRGVRWSHVSDTGTAEQWPSDAVIRCAIEDAARLFAPDVAEQIADRALADLNLSDLARALDAAAEMADRHESLEGRHTCDVRAIADANEERDAAQAEADQLRAQVKDLLRRPLDVEVRDLQARVAELERALGEACAALGSDGPVRLNVAERLRAALDRSK